MAAARPTFEILKAEKLEGMDDEWYFRLKSRNGEILASGETYTSHSDAVEGAKAARRSARIAKIEE